MQNQLEKEENKMLREENEALTVEQQAIKEAVLKKTCAKCGGPVVPHDENPEKMHLLLDNVRLKEELRRLNSVLKEATGKAPMPMPMPYSYSQLVADLDINGTDSALVMDPVMSPPPNHALRVQGCVHGSCASKRSALLGRVLRARDEFLMLVKDDAMWLPTLDGEMLEYPRYHKVTFPGILGFCPFGFGAYGTRDAGIVMGTGPELVSILTDPVTTL
jgi:homeobox-leucine zipper protein